ncbi:cytidine deaminase [Drosophila subobscura]|uniref:cytidine deaminase n=1 Tax=Drosophila subobscura TaxID=7241 RepID=UPI00155B3275|nr:cytidine deaminase [Drosophila subobscura]XP_034670322.1 cytidine deaminase [Drosophila subobscura]
MSDKRQLLKKYMRCLDEMKNELKRRQLKKTLKTHMKTLHELECEINQREGKQATLRQRGRVCDSRNLPHPQMLEEYTTQFCRLSEEARELLESALAARRDAYVPYSKFPVGAAFRSKCGYVYAGCNIENVAFTPGCCAERTALAKGVSEGQMMFTGGAVVAYHPKGFTMPCGVCRQFMREFACRDFPIYIAKAPAPELADRIPAIEDEDEVLVTSVYRLLPHSFSTFE